MAIVMKDISSVTYTTSHLEGINMLSFNVSRNGRLI